MKSCVVYILTIMTIALSITSCGTSSVKLKDSCDGIFRNGVCMNKTYYYYRDFPADRRR